MKNNITQQAIDLLVKLIQTPSFSGEENQTANLIEAWLTDREVETNRHQNNIWASNKYFDSDKPTILLNSHHDTVKPNKAYTNDPFEAKRIAGKLYGLGSNDAGGCLVSLMALFIHFYKQKNLKYNLLIAATAEEEISGKNGITSILKILPKIDFAVVGEPTEMHMAVAEKGLMVLDGYATGVSGHAAHENTENAIYNALEDVDWMRNHQFLNESETLGKVKMSVTQINAGAQHNVVPATCHFVVDVRVNELYTNQEIFNTMQEHTKSNLIARSFRLNSSSIPVTHPIVKAGKALHLKTYGSPTISDQALLTCPSVKIGPGISSRSHSANEFIMISEIEEGIQLYIQIFNQLL
ncbi:acetylornithine deacetylase [Putridiphycobacter roseus]|uniref:Acetylornithine deacetylase n=1 Tax=Putridiphycobacter roseus TaxID=2219161 RepID=A0A2W1N3P4_9FLAO|nr:M20 family metallo-hydrolase [Putridiphycobacter roseus]PZE17661.1 acetylornithine deacetylase [Putridiphycobacter roseus]